MSKRMIMITAVGVASLGLASASYAATCIAASTYLGATQYLQTGYSYTDESQWQGDAGKGYTAERIDGGGGMAYFQDISPGGFHFFDNGSFSPWRKTSFYNWYDNNNLAGVSQANENGPCW